MSPEAFHRLRMAGHGKKSEEQKRDEAAAKAERAQALRESLLHLAGQQRPLQVRDALRLLPESPERQVRDALRDLADRGELVHVKSGPMSGRGYYIPGQQPMPLDA